MTQTFGKKPNYIDSGIRRMDAHEYEKKIQELLEKIDILESRIRLTGEQKFKAVEQCKELQEENDDVKNQIINLNNAKKDIEREKEKSIKRVAQLEKANDEIKKKLQDRIDILNQQMKQKDKDMNELKQQVKTKNETLNFFNAKNEAQEKYKDDFKDELEKQKEKNKKQSEKIRELEKQIDTLYIQKQSEGALLLEINHLKDDNMRLLQMLKTTDQFKDFAYIGPTVAGGVRFVRTDERPKSSGISKAGNKKNAQSNKVNKMMSEGAWVPSDAQSFVSDFSIKYGLQISENLLNELLVGLNKIWQEREKRQVNSVKNQYQSEIMSLRRKLEMAPNMDQFNTKEELKSLRKQLTSTRDTLRDNMVVKNTCQTNPHGIGLVDNALKVAVNFQNTKKCMQNEIDKLRKQLAMKEVKYSGGQHDYNQGCYWMCCKCNDEISLLEKNARELYQEYENRIRNVDYGEDYTANSYINKIYDNNVRWLYNSLISMVQDVKDKLAQWKFDTQKDIDVLRSDRRMIV